MAQCNKRKDGDTLYSPSSSPSTIVEIGANSFEEGELTNTLPSSTSISSEAAVFGYKRLSDIEKHNDDYGKRTHGLTATRDETQSLIESHILAVQHCKEEEDGDLTPDQRVLLKGLAARAKTLMDENDARVAITPPKPTRILASPFKFHPKTGKIRKPRDWDTSDEDSGDSAGTVMDYTKTSPRKSPGTVPKLATPLRNSFVKGSQSPSSPGSHWVGSPGKNKPKCPPCHRLKKADPCTGPAPCKECYRKGRTTAEQCQEWGENYVPKLRAGAKKGN